MESKQFVGIDSTSVSDISRGSSGGRRPGTDVAAAEQPYRPAARPRHHRTTPAWTTPSRCCSQCAPRNED